MTVPSLPSGLYDLLLTESLERLLTNDATARHQVQPLADDAADVLADGLVRQLKSEGYHDRITYRDYAISTERFHWQSQNSAGPDTPVGRRYLDSGTNGWSFQLFVRVRKAEPYRACGPVLMKGAEGNRPMSITWKLATPLPAKLFREFSVLRDG